MVYFKFLETRNALVHPKPENQFRDETHKLENKHAGKFEANPLASLPWYPHQVLAAGCADWVWATCLESAQLWWERMGLQRDLLSEFSPWPDPMSEPPLGRSASGWSVRMQTPGAHSTKD
ncbi:hypothetical protein NJB1604_21280 [Mycobacterium marinum]|nr:hypothetical protein NJB1604_21280 [Mycobacterium marinum]